MNADYFIGLLTQDQIIDLVKKMFLLNECSGKQAYQLSKINIDNSGYAFGICQHDCGQRADAREFVKRCLSSSGVAEEQINKIMRVLADHLQKLSSTQLEVVNVILSMPSSTESINQFDVEYIRAAVEYVKTVVRQDVEILSSDQILTKPEIFLQLVDYHNQFHLSATGLLISFLNGQTINRSGIGSELSANGNITKIAKLDITNIDIDLLSEIRRFINEYTQYGLSHRHDCVRRQQNIDSIVSGNVPA